MASMLDQWAHLTEAEVRAYGRGYRDGFAWGKQVGLRRPRGLRCILGIHRWVQSMSTNGPVSDLMTICQRCAKEAPRG